MAAGDSLARRSSESRWSDEQVDHLGGSKWERCCPGEWESRTRAAQRAALFFAPRALALQG